MAKKQEICPELKILGHVTFMTRSKAPIWQRTAGAAAGAGSCHRTGEGRRRRARRGGRSDRREERKAALKKLLRQTHPGIAYNRTFDVEGSIVFHHACKLGCEGIVSKRLGSPYRSGRSADRIKVKNPKAPAVKREAEEDWGR